MKQATKRTALILALLMSFSLLAACSDNTGTGAPTGDSGTTTAPAPEGTTAPATTEGGEAPSANADRELKMTMMSGTDAATLDAYIATGSTAWLMCHSLYDHPWVIDLDFNIHYRMATGYEISEDGKVYTITIRDDAKFHDGTPVTSEDFGYSLEMSQNAPSSMSWASYIDTIEVVDATTVRFTLTQPHAPLVSLMQDMFIVPKAAHQAANGDFGYNPVGSGPYKLKEYNVGNSVILEAFEDYYLEPAAIKTVSYKLIPEKATVSIALETKEIDFSNDFAMTDMARLEGLDHLQLITQPVKTYDYLILNNTKAPFDNKLVRQAFNYAINKQAVIDVVYEGYGVPESILVNDLVFGFSDVDGYEYNPEKAKELLAEAGYPNGEGFPLTPLYCYSGGVKVMQVVQQSLKDIGLDLPIEEIDLSLLFEYIENSTSEVAHMSIGLGSDAAEYGTMVQTGGGYNFAFYSNSDLDELFNQAAAVSDPAARQALYDQIWDLYLDEVPYAVICFHVSTILCSTDLDISGADTFGLYGASNILPYYLKWK